MIIKVTRHSQNFTVVSNTPFLDSNISFKARGILAYLLVHPPDWQVRMEDLIRNSGKGREYVVAGFQELRAHGYARLVAHRNSQGQMTGNQWHIFENPEDYKPTVKRVSRLTANPFNGKPGHILSNKKKLKTNGHEGVPGGLPADLVPKPTQFPNTKAGKLCHRFEQFVKSNRLDWIITKKGEQARVRINRQTWITACETLLDIEGHATIKEVLLWFVEHHKDPWLPKCASMVTFCQQFERIQRAMCRDTKRNLVDSGETVKLAETAERLAQEFRR